MPPIFDWIDPGNAGGSVVIPELPKWTPFPAWHQCPYCPEKPITAIELQIHVGKAHPVERPTLLLRGVLAQSNLRIRRRIKPDEITLLHNKSVEVLIDGSVKKTLSAEALPDFVANQTSAHLCLKLLSEKHRTPFSTEYVIDIAVPNEEELDLAEKHFFQYLARGDVRLRDVEDYAKSCKALNSCQDYVSALADFVLGVLIKDQSGDISIGVSEFVDKFQQTLECLREFDRSLARVLIMFIRINLNDFSSPPVASGIANLDLAFSFFSDRATNAIEHATSELSSAGNRHATMKRVCPIDQVTGILLKAIERLGDLRPQIAKDLADELESLAQRTNANQADRAKARVILSELWLNAGRSELATHQLATLTNNAVFGQWAEARQAKGIVR